jgi:hypothetical protein
METVRDSWTDERLDDMGRRMELGFAEVKTELRREIGSVRQEMRQEIGSVRQEMRQGIGSVRQEIGSVRDEMRQELAAIDDRLHGMQRMMIQFQGILIAALIGLIATQL